MPQMKPYNGISVLSIYKIPVITTFFKHNHSSQKQTFEIRFYLRKFLVLP